MCRYADFLLFMHSQKQNKPLNEVNSHKICKGFKRLRTHGSFTAVTSLKTNLRIASSHTTGEGLDECGKPSGAIYADLAL